MKSAVSSSEQTNEIRKIALFTLILLIISFVGLFYKVFAYRMIRPNIELFDKLYIGIAVVNFVKFILLILFGILLSRVLKYNIRLNWLINFTFISGILVLFCMYGDWGALHDIFQREPDTTLEWSFLRTGLIINFIFHTAGLLTLIRIRS